MSFDYEVETQTLRTHQSSLPIRIMVTLWEVVETHEGHGRRLKVHRESPGRPGLGVARYCWAEQGNRMSDRTPEEREADEQLIAAINHREQVYGTSTGVLTEWVVITSRAFFDDEGDAVTATDYYGGEDQPVHRTYGLLAWILERCRVTYLDEGQGRVE